MENNEIDKLKSMEQIIFGLNSENFSQSIISIISMLEENYIYSFNQIISQMLYFAYVIRTNDFDIFLHFLKEIDANEANKNMCRISNFFIHFLLHKETQESYYLIEKMIIQSMIDPKEIKKQIKTNPYFMHYMSFEEFESLDDYYPFVKYIHKNYAELSKNDCELHKQLINEGVNPNEIAKIIRYDEIEKLQEISSQENFDFNQFIEPSLYERCSFINQDNVSLIDYAAFFGSIKCFKYLLMNGSKLYYTGKYAAVGGNLEIIHLCEKNHSSFEASLESAIEFHRNNIFTYIYENKMDEINYSIHLGKTCVLYHNYEVLSYILEKGMEAKDSIINQAARMGNIFLIKYFLQENLIPDDILTYSSESGNIELVKYILEQEDIDINEKNNNEKTSLIIASENGYTDIVKLLLEQQGIDINIKDNDGNTALIFASTNGYLDIVKLLLKQKGNDVNTKDDENIAFIRAAKNGHIEIVKLFIEQNSIDVNTKDKYGNTALIEAAKKGYTDIVKFFLKQKRIDINARNWNGDTALMEASYYGNIEIVKLLIEQEGIDINAQNNDGQTPLTFAMKNYHTEIFELLLKTKRGYNK